MAASMLYRIIGLFLLSVIYFTSGLLSDYKICGDAECESRMSRVQALEDHNSKDCRFLSFRKGDIIFVYHKLTGQREDLWAGSIDRRFGYFPKAAVKEEEIYAKAEKVLETHQSDFFCMDENGYPIDTTENENNAATTDKAINPEVTQVIPPTLESPSQKSHETSIDAKTKSGEEEEEEGDKAETLNDQSESSSWLRSSVTGLWGLVQKGDSSTNSEEVTTKETAELSVTSSVTGWLGFGAKQNGESGEKPGTQDSQGSSNLDSAMTGWLNFGSEVKEQDNAKSAQADNAGEVFRSRKIALDFEDNQVYQEENKETGTLGWIGNGISNTLGFGSNNKDSGEGKSEEIDKNLEPSSNSWFDVGITDMLGFRKDVAKEKINRIEDLPVLEQNTDTLPNVPPLEQSKQPEIMDEKIVETDSTNLNKDIKESNDDYNHNTATNAIQRGTSNHTDPEMKPEQKEVELRTSDASSMEDGSKSVEFIDPKQIDEDTTISSNCELSFDPQVIYDQDIHHLQLEHNVTEAKTDSLLENNAGSQIEKFEISETELQMNKGETMPVEELDSSKVDETDCSEVNTNQEIQDTPEDQESHQEMSSTIKVVNNIQDVFNDKKAMTEEVIEAKQDVVNTDEPLNELKVRNDGDEETLIEDTLGQIKENGEQETNDNAAKKQELDVELNNNEEIVESETSGEMAQCEEKILESAEDSHKEEKDELKGKGWELDEGTQVMNKEEENPEEVALIQESSKTNLDIINGQQRENNNYLYEAVKEVKQQPAVEGNINIEENGPNLSLEELQEIVSSDDQASKNSENSLEERQNLTEQNVHEDTNQSLFDILEATELVKQTADLDVKEENTDKLVNLSHKFSHDLNIDENNMTEADSSSGNNKMEEEIEEPTRTSDEIEEVLGIFNNTFSFVTNTVSIEPTVEATADEPQVSISSSIAEEDVKLINNSEDDSTVFSASQTTISQSPRATTLNSKTLHKLYSNILTYMNADEVMILIHSFGEHKLQFLDYILSNLDSATSEHDADLSILLDIERLLSYHIETLMIPKIRTDSGIQEDKEKTRTLIALQKLEIILEKVKEAFNMIKTDLDNEQDMDKELNNEIMEEIHGTGKVQAQDQRHDMEGVTHQMLDILEKMATEALTQTHATLELITWITVQVVSALPDDIRPGPDLYGVPWEPVIISGLVGLITILIFTCRCFSSVKSRMYRRKERQMAEQVAQLLDEKCKVLETLSKVQQEFNGIEDSLRDGGVLAQTQKAIQLEAKAKQLEHTKREFEKDLEQLKDQLNQQREHRLEQEQRIMVLEDSIKTCEEETKMFQSQDEQAQTTLKVYSMNSDRLQRNLETAGEENALLQENNMHLHQQLEGWAERVSELEQEMRRCEHSHSGMLQDVATKDERIMSLTDRLLQMKAWDSDLEEEQGAEGETLNGIAGRKKTSGKGDITDTQGHLQKVQKLIHAAKLNADLKSVDEDKDRIFAKLNDEVKAKEDLQGSIKGLEIEKLSLQSDAKHYTDQVQVLQQKLQIMTEMYQENELKLHRLLTVEEKERLQKEEKLNKADKNIAMAMEELNNYRQRAEEMEEELEKTKQSYQTQISSHEKKAHNNWLAARSAERELAEIRRENALFRQKLTDTQFKLEAIEKDPYALDSLARPLPFRAERSYGPSPLGRPASETRAFLSPPTLMDGPPNRLSPRVMRGPLEPLLGAGETERPGGPHSDSGSISPTWERDRRGPPPGPMLGPLPGPPGPMAPPRYIFPEPGGPMYRRPPPGPMGPYSAPGPLLPRGNRPPGPPLDMADGPYRENSLGPGEHDLREPGPGERRTPPEADLRIGGMPPPGPIDGPFPRRAPYGPPPPEYYLPRGPGGPTMPVWGPPPPGMMYPPRFPPGGPYPPSMGPYSGPPMHPHVPDGHPPPSIAPPQPPPPALTQRQSSEERTESPQDII